MENVSEPLSLARLAHSARVVAAFALGGAVVFGLGLGWIPALATVDMHAVGAAAGGLAGIAVQTQHFA